MKAPPRPDRAFPPPAPRPHCSPPLESLRTWWCQAGDCLQHLLRGAAVRARAGGRGVACPGRFSFSPSPPGLRGLHPRGPSRWRDARMWKRALSPLNSLFSRRERVGGGALPHRRGKDWKPNSHTPPLPPAPDRPAPHRRLTSTFVELERRKTLGPERPRSGLEAESRAGAQDDDARARARARELPPSSSGPPQPRAATDRGRDRAPPAPPPAPAPAARGESGPGPRRPGAAGRGGAGLLPAAAGAGAVRGGRRRPRGPGGLLRAGRGPGRGESPVAPAPPPPASPRSARRGGGRTAPRPSPRG